MKDDLADFQLSDQAIKQRADDLWVAEIDSIQIGFAHGSFLSSNVLLNYANHPTQQWFGGYVLARGVRNELAPHPAASFWLMRMMEVLNVQEFTEDALVGTTVTAAIHQGRVRAIAAGRDWFCPSEEFKALLDDPPAFVWEEPLEPTPTFWRPPNNGGEENE